MDFGAIAIHNPVMGHSSHIDEKAKSWGGFEADILSYLSDINNLQAFANMAQNAAELSERLDPFLENAKTAFEALEKLNNGQVTWTELRKQYGNHVANAIAKIRKLNASFNADMELLDASDRAEMLRIEERRKNALNEVAVQLRNDLQAELFRHQNKISSIENRHTVQAERQTVQNRLHEQRQLLLNRARYGDRAFDMNRAPKEVIPVQMRSFPVADSVSPTGKNRGWGNLWDKLGER
ncbi:hypothetical protein H6G69_11030 [Nostoc sp. FACHB-110]|nr:hypothetical protein [Nostoc sp. FACHB-110]